MKIAICFSGSIRDFPTCFPSIKRHILDNLNADIFLHLWKMDDLSTLNSNVNFKWRNDACTEQYVIDKLKPVKYVIDKYSKDWEEKIIKESKINIDKLINIKLESYANNACGMYYKIMKSYELVEEFCMENNVKYDIVIRARLDFIWEDNLENKDLVTDKLCLIKDRYASHSGLVTNDKFFAGSMDIMKKMCDLFNHISIYQNNGLMVEGQTLHEHHIKNCGFDVKWIGNSHTYYKCMGRHAIHYNRHTILIDNDQYLADFWYELAYYLLYNNYQVVYIGTFANNITYANTIDTLMAFPNFKLIRNKGDYGDNSNNDKNNNSDKNNNRNKIINNKLDQSLCLIGNKLIDCQNIKQIIINGSVTTTTTTTTYITVNNKINNKELVDFVHSIILTSKYGGQYNFTNKKLISKINPNEKVVFKYLDRGYFLSTLLSHNLKNDKYIIKVNDKNVNSIRQHFKLVDLLKYHDVNEPWVMPVNINKNDKPIL